MFSEIFFMWALLEGGGGHLGTTGQHSYILLLTLYNIVTVRALLFFTAGCRVVVPNIIFGGWLHISNLSDRGNYLDAQNFFLSLSTVYWFSLFYNLHTYRLLYISGRYYCTCYCCLAITSSWVCPAGLSRCAHLLSCFFWPLLGPLSFCSSYSLPTAWLECRSGWGLYPPVLFFRRELVAGRGVPLGLRWSLGRFELVFRLLRLSSPCRVFQRFFSYPLGVRCTGLDTPRAARCLVLLLSSSSPMMLLGQTTSRTRTGYLQYFT